MSVRTQHIYGMITQCRLAFCLLIVAAVASPVSSYADNAPQASPRVIQQALASKNRINLYGTNNSAGFKLSSSYFSSTTANLTPAANINTDQRLYALLIDGRYDFNYETTALESPLRPYVSGGVGLATAGRANGGGDLGMQGGDVAPMFRLGGGVAYRLDSQWNMSLDYKAGRASIPSGDQLFTGRSQQPVDLQALNLGMSYSF